MPALSENDGGGQAEAGRGDRGCARSSGQAQGPRLAGFVWAIACITSDPPAATGTEDAGYRTTPKLARPKLARNVAVAEHGAPASLRLAPCSPPSSTLRAGSAGGLGPCLILVANSGGEPDQAIICRVANCDMRVFAERVSLCHSETLTKLTATAVITCCKRVFANPM